MSSTKILGEEVIIVLKTTFDESDKHEMT